MSTTSAARRIESKLTLVWSAPSANDNARTWTAQDALLDEIDAVYLQLHRRAFRGRSARFTVRYVGELVTEELVLAYTRRRVESWRVEMSEPIESVQMFTLQIH
jgi:hypothetical protein